MRLALVLSLQLASLSLPLVVSADAVPTPPSPAEPAQSELDPQLAQLESSLQYKSGDVVVGDKLATLHLGNELGYLGPADAEKELVAWGNPPGGESLGMLIPRAMSPFADESWAVIVRYVEEGHVDDVGRKSAEEPTDTPAA